MLLPAPLVEEVDKGLVFSGRPGCADPAQRVLRVHALLLQLLLHLLNGVHPGAPVEEFEFSNCGVQFLFLIMGEMRACVQKKGEEIDGFGEGGKKGDAFRDFIAQVR